MEGVYYPWHSAPGKLILTALSNRQHWIGKACQGLGCLSDEFAFENPEVVPVLVPLRQVLDLS